MNTETLAGTAIVLEVDCGTDHFTIPAARIIGERRLRLAIDGDGAP